MVYEKFQRIGILFTNYLLPVTGKSVLLVVLIMSPEAHTKVRCCIDNLQFWSFFEEPPITNSLRGV